MSSEHTNLTTNEARQQTRNTILIGIFAVITLGSAATYVLITSGMLNNLWISIPVFVVLAFVSLYFAVRFSSFDIRTKIVLGIIITGGVALITLATFAIDRTNRITNLTLNRFQISANALAEEQLTSTVSKEAGLINEFFSDVESQVKSLAAYRVSLNKQQTKLNENLYWDATTQLTQLESGQYGNSPSDISSVFIPVNRELTESLIADLNTSAYLDFMAPQILSSNTEVLSIYSIDPLGVTRYYPNINLASILPADFDATSRPYYRITSPLFNKDRLTRWTIPYKDATGGGLVVTVAAPVYYGDEFHGIVAADVKLSNVTSQAENIKIGNTGYAFIIDSDGRVITMPPAGYKMYGITAEELPSDEFFKQTLVGVGPTDLSSVTRRMVAGGSGINVIKVDGIDTYISYSPIKSSSYTLAVVVPVSEMQQAYIKTQAETQGQLNSAAQLALIIFASLFLLAIIISLSIGQIIATPIIRLTQTANQIVEGDLGAQAVAISQDEIGTLAQAFNTMTHRLREALAGMEQRVEERTADLVKANEKIERRAKQFASISEISRVINQTQNLQDLLPQITQVISQQLGFYHVGIFLIDSKNEYAELVASNSEGGQKMLMRSHKLKIGHVGIVGNVAGTSNPRIALDTGDDSIYFNNPDLPETHSEIALPLFRTGRHIIGVLDVQSVETNAFEREDIQVLSTLADQVSIAITNARLYEETQKALIESEMVYRSQLRVGWEKFTNAIQITGIRRQGAKSEFLNEHAAPLNEMNATNVAENNMEGAQITMPVKLRGETVGVLKLRSSENRPFTNDQIDIINAIIERTALSMENSRLLTESQRQVNKERVIGEISSKISGLVNIENILKTAVQELGSTLPNTDIAIQFKQEDSE